MFQFRCGLPHMQFLFGSKSPYSLRFGKNQIQVDKVVCPTLEYVLGDICNLKPAFYNRNVRKYFHFDILPH